MSNLIWEIHFEGRVLINKTPRKFVCFDGIEGRKETCKRSGKRKGRKKIDKKRAQLCVERSKVWSGREKDERRKKRKKVRARVWRGKFLGSPEV